VTTCLVAIIGCTDAMGPALDNIFSFPPFFFKKKILTNNPKQKKSKITFTIIKTNKKANHPLKP